MRYRVTGVASDADAAKDVTDRLRQAGLEVADSYVALQSLEGLRRSTSSAADCDGWLLLLSNESSSLTASHVELDALLSLRSAGAALVQAVLLEEARAPVGDIVRIASFRGAKRISELAGALARVEAEVRVKQDRVDERSGRSGWDAFVDGARTVRLVALGLMAIFVLLFGRGDPKLLVVAILALLLVAWSVRTRSRRSNRERPVEADAAPHSGSEATPVGSARPLPASGRVGWIVVSVLLCSGLALLVVARVEVTLRRSSRRNGEPVSDRYYWELAGGMACALLAAGIGRLLSGRKRAARDRPDPPRSDAT